MPRKTFFNLPEEKKARIFHAAVAEFATHRFSEASINQIIKQAGISRGSFYQYFTDKEDIYLYVIKEIGREKAAFLAEKGILDAGDDFFTAYLQMFKAALLWAETKPLYNRIGMLMEMDNSEFARKMRDLSKEGFAMLSGMIERDKSRALIRQDIETDLIIEIFYTLLVNILLNVYRSGKHEALLPVAEKICAVLKYGIAGPALAAGKGGAENSINDNSGRKNSSQND